MTFNQNHAVALFLKNTNLHLIVKKKYNYYTSHISPKKKAKNIKAPTHENSPQILL